MTTTADLNPANYETPRDRAIDAAYDALTTNADQPQDENTRALAKTVVSRLELDGVRLNAYADLHSDGDALETRARASYDDAVRLDAFGPEEARQAFLEGYVRGARA